MLPEILSNELCSLKPNEDKFTVVAEIIINNFGKIKSYKFYNAIINSSARLTYGQVEGFLKNKSLIKDKDVAKNLNSLFLNYIKYLKMQEKKRNAINFDTQEFFLL